MSGHLRRAADLAEKLWEAGHDSWSIVQELRHAADAEEFGWTGTAYFGTDAGLIPLSEADELRSRVEKLIGMNDRSKTVPKDKLTEAIDG